MSKLGIYSVLDKKANRYATPFFAANDDVAQRMFDDVCRNEQSDLFKFPSDFRLVRLGFFVQADEPLNELQVVGSELVDAPCKLVEALTCVQHYKAMKDIQECSDRPVKMLEETNDH